MQKENRKGLALGAVFALVASLFGTVPAASASEVNDAHMEIYPEAGTAFTGLLVDDFSIYLQLDSGVTNANFTESKLVWQIEKAAGTLDLHYSVSERATVANLGSTASSQVLNAASTSVTLSASVSADANSFLTGLTLRASTASGITSASPAMTVTITAFIDDQGIANGTRDPGEWYSQQTITLIPTNDVAATVTLTQNTEGDVKVTASAAISTGLNWDQVNGKFFLAMSSSGSIYTANRDATATGSHLSGATVGDRNGVVSQSFTVVNVSGSDTVGAALRYVTSGTAATIYDGFIIGSAVSKTITEVAINSLALSVVKSADVTASATPYTVRPNQPFTVKALTKTSSTTVSAVTVTFTVAESGMSWPTKYLVVAGATTVTTDSATIEVDAVSGADGYASITVTPVGFAAGDSFTVDAEVGNVGASAITINAAAPAYTVVNDYDLLKTAAGTGVVASYKVKDQWGQLSSRTDQRLKITRGGTGFAYATTVSYVSVVAGVASFTFTPSPVAKTGSATIKAELEYYDADSNVYSDGGTDDSNITVNVSGDADGFTTSNVATLSVSVSYVADSGYVWSSTMSGTVVNGGSAVLVSAPGLVLQDVATGDTASGAITVRANSSGVFEIYAAGEKSGTYPVTFTNGAGSPTSEVVVDDPASDQGVAIVWDTTEITAGKTKIVTGTLVDTNSNAVDTTAVGATSGDSGTASIVVTYAGTAGIPVGTMPTETDANGQFKVSILTSAADSGTFTLTAVYLPQGASTVAAKKLTSVQSISVGEAAASSSDQKVNAGSFKGYVAVYAKGYAGQRMSAKIGNDWVVVESLASNFERVVDFTGAGYTIAVRIYIDRVLVDTITVTTK